MNANADVTVREVMNHEYPGVSESDSLVDTVELMLREDEPTALVHRGNELVGLVGERDVMEAVVDGEPSAATVGEVMTESVPTIDAEESVDGAAAEMSTRNVDGLVVTNGGGEPLGLVTERDLLAASTYRTGESGADATRRESVAAMEESGDPATEGEAFPDQSICESCGTLASNLASFNGQLLCADCRSF